MSSDSDYDDKNASDQESEVEENEKSEETTSNGIENSVDNEKSVTWNDLVSFYYRIKQNWK